MEPKITISSTPHIRSSESIDSIMRDVFISLIPATIAGFYFFGLRALLIIILSIASSVGFEYLYQKYTKQPITINDWSAAVTGLLIALGLPSTAGWWTPIVGSMFAIIIVKQLFGGLGQNFLNPALAARAFLTVSYPTYTMNYVAPVNNFLGMDAVSQATPLTNIKVNGFSPESSDIIAAIVGNISGCIGETSALALLLGGAYLVHKKIINWRLPATIIFTTFVFTALFKFGNPDANPLYEMFTGGLLITAIFMATDYSSSPITPIGTFIYAVGIGLMIAVIRAFGSAAEGVTYAILFMSLFVPILDKYCRPRVFGTTKKGGK